jgi:pimeloyl-ACP methyl ester carboxylesterase
VTVLLLHGQPGSGGDWAGVTRALRERGLEVLAPDRPGYGSSELPAGGFDYNARAVVGLLDEPALVVGHSWGAGVALALAQVYPDRVSAAVLVCPVTPEDRLGRLDRVLAGRVVGPVMARAGFLGAGAVLGRERLRRRLESALPGSDPQRWSDVTRAWRSFWIEQRALLDDLPAMSEDLVVPTTVVIGARDHVTDPAAGRRYATKVGARLVEVPDAGHLLPMQRPEEVADILVQARSLTSESRGAR